MSGADGDSLYLYRNRGYYPEYVLWFPKKARTAGDGGHVRGGAYEAGKRRDFAAHDRLIQEKIRELDGRYEQIVLAQISMAGAAAGVVAGHARVFTSPESAYQSLMRAVSGEVL